MQLIKHGSLLYKVGNITNPYYLKAQLWRKAGKNICKECNYYQTEKMS